MLSTTLKVSLPLVFIVTFPTVGFCACQGDQCGPVVLDEIIVTGPPLDKPQQTNPNSSSRVSAISSLIGYPGIYQTTHFASQARRDNLTEYLNDLKNAYKQSHQTSDVRCSALPSPNTRNTTSEAGSLFEVRNQAANQLFQALVAEKNLTGLKAALANGKPAMRVGKLTPTFEITYSDGGKESWFVDTTGSVPRLLPSPPVDGTLVPGTGTPQPCPIGMES